MEVGKSEVTESEESDAEQPPSLVWRGQPEASTSASGQQQPGQEGDAENSSPRSDQQLKVEDARNYLDEVKNTFLGQPRVYNSFLETMKKFKSQVLSTDDVISTVLDLFRNQPELIRRFNIFLPPGFTMEPVGNTTSSVAVSVARQAHSQRTVVKNGSPVSVKRPVLQQISTAPTIPAQPRDATILSANSNSQPQPSSSSSFTQYSASALAEPVIAAAAATFQTKPVQFSAALDYVNKIRATFIEQPEKYSQFLEILDTYQKENLENARNNGSQDSDPVKPKVHELDEVYLRVAKLFEGNEDLLAEFCLYIPEVVKTQMQTNSKVVTNVTQEVPTIQPNPPEVVVQKSKKRLLVQSDVVVGAVPPPTKMKKVSDVLLPLTPKEIAADTESASTSKQTKLNTESASMSKEAPVPKIPLRETQKYGTLNEYELFDKIRMALDSEKVYESFLQCLKLFNDELINKVDLIKVVQPFLVKHTNLFSSFKKLLTGSKDGKFNSEAFKPPTLCSKSTQKKLAEEDIMEIDFSSCRRLGASYCALPNSHTPTVCSGRTDLEKSVLNDKWVSFPTWSEDSTFGNSRKTIYEEHVYRVEDERYELDAVIETNYAAIQSLSFVTDAMSRMSQRDQANYQLDDRLGSNSETITQRAVWRLYGDKSPEIIEALKLRPSVAVPVVLKRLKNKQKEWTDAQKGFNKIWAEQMQKHYLKSLDHQASAFKQNDIRVLRPKALTAEIETLKEERRGEQKNEDGEVSNSGFGPFVAGIPHLSLQYGHRSVLQDACDLLLHHVRRQSGIQKEDKRKIKRILKHFLFDIFHHGRMELSDDELEEGAPDSSDGDYEGNEDKGKKIASKNTDTSKRNRRESRKCIPIKKNLQENQPEKEHQPQKKTISRRPSAKVRKQKTNEKGGSGSNSRSGENDSRSSKIKRRQYVEAKYFVAKMDHAVAELEDKHLKSTYNVLKEHVKVFEHGTHESGGNNTTLVVRKSPEQEEAYTLLYVNQAWYVFLRLHHVLCERLNRLMETANKIIAEEEAEGQTSPGPAVNLLLRAPRLVEPEEYYSSFLEMIRKLLDGNLDAATFEDTMRERFGVHDAYVSFTLDKLIINAVRQLQSLVTDDISLKCMDLYRRHNRRGGAGGTVELKLKPERIQAEIMYRKTAQRQLEGDACIRTVIYKKMIRMNMESLDAEKVACLDHIEFDAKLLFVSNLLQDNLPHAQRTRAVMGLNPIFLQRNLTCKKRYKNKNGRQRGEHDYVARQFHRDDMPKYYAPKHPSSQMEIEIGGAENPNGGWDVELDLLHNPEKYKYLYDRDIMSIIVIPSEYISIPSVVRNALLQKPVRMCTKPIVAREVGQLRQERFGKWHRGWLKHFATSDARRKVDNWFLGWPNDESINIQSENCYNRVVHKYVTETRPKFYAFPTAKDISRQRQNLQNDQQREEKTTGKQPGEDE